MPKAYSYIRFSTPEQIKGDSLRRQTMLSEKYALEHNLDLDITLNLKDLGVSAYDRSNITKGALGVFLKLIQDGKIAPGSFLLVESLDRLSRAQILDALEVFISILNAEISIVTLADNITYTRLNANTNWTSLMMSLLIMARATEESQTKSRRGRAAWDNKRANLSQKRLTARCPNWLKVTKEDTGFEVIPERVEIVKNIFEMSKNGFGTYVITKRLNELGVPPFSNKSDGWQSSYVEKLLTNKAVYGEFSMSLQRDGLITSFGNPVENYYPVVIEKDEWLLVNARRAERKTKGGRAKGKYLSNLFSGLFLCAYCGGPMVMGGHIKQLPNKPSKSKKYVVCSTSKRGLGCLYMSWNYDALESKILQFCHSVDFDQVLGNVSNNINLEEGLTKKILSLESDIKSTQSKLENLLLALENGEGVQSKSLLNRINSYDEDINNLNDDLLKTKQTLTTISLEAKSNTNQYQTIRNVLKGLKAAEGTELHDLRIRLSAQIKRVVSFIFLHPAGNWMSEEKKLQLQKEINNRNGTQISIESMFSKYSAPERNNRYLQIMFKNNQTIVVGKDSVINNSDILTRQEYLDALI